MCQFKREPFFSVFHVKTPPWKKGAHSPELLSQQLCRASLSRHQPWAPKGRSLPALSVVHSFLADIWQHSLFKPTGTWVVVFNSVLIWLRTPFIFIVFASTTWHVKKWVSFPFKNFLLISPKTGIFSPPKMQIRWLQEMWKCLQTNWLTSPRVDEMGLLPRT